MESSIDNGKSDGGPLRGVLTLAGVACFAAALILLCSGADAPEASHTRWFWWLKAAAAPLGAGAVALLRAAQRTRGKDDKHS